VIAAIGLAVVVVNEWITQAIDNANTLRQRTEMELTIANIQNELVYALGTQPMTYRGLESGRLIQEVDLADATALMTADYQTDQYIRLDGTPYRMASAPDYVVQIFDGRGLINLNAAAPAYLRRLLGLFNVPEVARNSLMDALEDYTDRDDLTRISGAEERDYVRAGRRAPANAWLMTPYEAQYVMGWDQLTDLWRRDLEAPLLTTCATSGFNPNTAPREAILSTFPNLVEANVQTVMLRRAERPFRNIREFAASVDTIVRDEPFFYTFAPGACAIVEVTHLASGDRSRFSLTIDSFSAKTKPWRIDYAFPIPAIPSSADREPAPEAVFPAPDTLDANWQQRPQGG
jgi:hypothetical protein